LPSTQVVGSISARMAAMPGASSRSGIAISMELKGFR
jgi:hypothetical protein